MVLKRPNKNPTQVGWKVQWTHAIFIRNILAMFHCLCFTPGTWLISPLETRKDLDYQRSPTSPSRWSTFGSQPSCAAKFRQTSPMLSIDFIDLLEYLDGYVGNFCPRNFLKFGQTSSVFSSRLKQGRKDGQKLTIWICDCSMVGKVNHE